MGKKTLLVVGTSSGVAVAAFLALILGFLVWKHEADKNAERERQEQAERQKAEEKAKRRTQRAQRKIYERFQGQTKLVALQNTSLRLAELGKDEAKIRKAREDLRQYEADLQKTVDDCTKEYGHHPAYYQNLPPLDSPYYLE